MKYRKKPIELKIGDKLYRHVFMQGIWEYTVFGIHQYKGSKQFAIRCEACTHGWKCELLVALDSSGNYSYVSMLNNDKNDDQRDWHEHGRKFSTSSNEAMLVYCKEILRDYEDKIDKTNKGLKNLQKHRNEIKDILIGLKSKSQ